MSHLIKSVVLSGFRQSKRSCQPIVAFAQQKQSFCTSRQCGLKEIHEMKTENMTVVEGIKVKSQKEDHLLNTPKSDACPLCRLNLDLKYTDVLILSQFLRADGCVLPRRVTGVCSTQQRKLEKLVNQAQRAGLLLSFRPDLKDGKERKSLRTQYKWKKFNVYFEDA